MVNNNANYTVRLTRLCFLLMIDESQGKQWLDKTFNGIEHLPQVLTSLTILISLQPAGCQPLI